MPFSSGCSSLQRWHELRGKALDLVRAAQRRVVLAGGPSHPCLRVLTLPLSLSGRKRSLSSACVLGSPCVWPLYQW